MSTITDIRDALVSIIGAASAVGTANCGYVSYSLLDTTTTGVACLVRPETVDNDPEGFGRYDTSTITCRCEVFVKHQGEDATYMGKQWSIVDDVLTVLYAADTLSGTCSDAICNRVEIRPVEYVIDGNRWQQIDFFVKATVYGR